jgi:hypothetical protein
MSWSSFEQILAPIWERWREGGMADDDVDELFEKELRAARRERRQSN